MTHRSQSFGSLTLWALVALGAPLAARAHWRAWQPPQASAPEVTSFEAHARPTRAVCFGSNGELYTAGEDGIVRVWNLGESSATATGEDTGEDTGAFSLASVPDRGLWAHAGQTQRDGTTVATAAVVPQGGDARQWFGAADEGASVALHPDGRTLAIVTRDWFSRPEHEGRIWLWAWEDGEPQVLHAAPGVSFLTVGFAPNGSRLAVGCDDGSTLVFQLPTEFGGDTDGQAPLVVGRHAAATTDVAFRADGRLLATAASEGSVLVWDATTGAPRGELMLRDASVRSIAFSADGRLAIAGGRLTGNASTPERQAGFVEIWDPELNGAQLSLAPDGGPVLDVSFSPDGARIAGGQNDGRVRIWDLAVALNALRSPG